MRHLLVASVAAVMVFATAERVNASASFELEIGPSIAGNSARVKKAALVVRSKSCDVATVTMSGTAEGLVNGRRQSVPLRLIELETPGVYAVQRVWEQGRWVLNLSGSCAERKATAAALVPLGPGGFDRASIKYLTRAATPAEVDAALRDTKTLSE
jgi:hypothetical protein